jgi:hypothetical protein
MTRPTAKEHIHMPMEHTILETGLMINSMEMVKNHGQMVLSMKVNTRMEKKMEKES